MFFGCLPSWTHSKLSEVFKALLKHPLVTVWQVNERHVLCTANQSQLARKRMKRNGMILAQCQRTKRGAGGNIEGDNQKISTKVASRWNIVEYELIDTNLLCFVECHTVHRRFKIHQKLVFSVPFWGCKNSWNFGNCLSNPGALDGTPSYRDRLPTVGRLVWKAQALYQGSHVFFGWQGWEDGNDRVFFFSRSGRYICDEEFLEVLLGTCPQQSGLKLFDIQNDENCKPSNQVLLTQLLRSKISQEPTGTGFDVSV